MNIPIEIIIIKRKNQYQVTTMPKRNYGLLDVVAAVRDINQLGVGYRVANLYDIDLKTYLFKLQKKRLS